MSPFYRDRQAINSGGGTGTRVTNACFEHTAKHSEEFHFVHCNYSNFKGTELSWGGISVMQQIKNYSTLLMTMMASMSLAARCLLKVPTLQCMLRFRQARSCQMIWKLASQPKPNTTWPPQALVQGQRHVPIRLQGGLVQTSIES